MASFNSDRFRISEFLVPYLITASLPLAEVILRSVNESLKMNMELPEAGDDELTDLHLDSTIEEAQLSSLDRSSSVQSLV